MTLVVSDGTPLNILIRIAKIDLLPAFFETVVVPKSVVEEMSSPSTPAVVRSWLATAPPWLVVRTPTKAVDASERRHRGERDAIALALEIMADAILLDEFKARAHAQELGLITIGTVGILERAADAGLLKDLAVVYQQLRESDFHVSEHLLVESLERNLARKREIFGD